MLISQAGATITVSYLGQPGHRDVRDESGSPLPNGNEVRVGCFEDGFDVASNAADLEALHEAWMAYNADDPNRFIRELSSQSGRFSSQFPRTDAGAFAGKKIYLWVFKTADDSAPLSNYSNVVEYGLFSASAGNWHFPSADDPNPLARSTTVTTSEVDESVYGGISTSSLSLQEKADEPQVLTYAQWQMTAFTAATMITDQEPIKDPDGDGLTNGVEFLIGEDPEKPSVSPWVSNLSESTLTVTYPRVRAVAPGTDLVQISQDMEDWDTDPSVVSESDPLDAERDLITVTVSIAGRQRCFVRVLVVTTGS